MDINLLRDRSQALFHGSYQFLFSVTQLNQRLTCSVMVIEPPYSQCFHPVELMQSSKARESDSMFPLKFIFLKPKWKQEMMTFRGKKENKTLNTYKNKFY